MEFVKNLLYILITAAVPVLTTYVCKFLYTKWTESKVNIKNEQIQDLYGIEVSSTMVSNITDSILPEINSTLLLL